MFCNWCYYKKKPELSVKLIWTNMSRSLDIFFLEIIMDWMDVFRSKIHLVLLLMLAFSFILCVDISFLCYFK